MTDLKFFYLFQNKAGGIYHCTSDALPDTPDLERWMRDYGEVIYQKRLSGKELSRACLALVPVMNSIEDNHVQYDQDALVEIVRNAIK